MKSKHKGTVMATIVPVLSPFRGLATAATDEVGLLVVEGVAETELRVGGGSWLVTSSTFSLNDCEPEDFEDSEDFELAFMVISNSDGLIVSGTSPDRINLLESNEIQEAPLGRSASITVLEGS